MTLEQLAGFLGFRLRCMRDARAEQRAADRGRRLARHSPGAADPDGRCLRDQATNQAHKSVAERSDPAGWQRTGRARDPVPAPPRSQKRRYRGARSLVANFPKPDMVMVSPLSGSEPHAVLRSEEVDAVEIGDHADLLAGGKGMPFVEDHVDLLAPRAPNHQRFGAGRLDDGGPRRQCPKCRNRARGAPGRTP